MSTTHYFTHVDGFCDGTAYIEVGDFGTRLVGESGAREDSTWTLDECVGNCREKVWKEISEADVLALNIPAAPVEPRDAQIAALTEKLRAVEAERDEWKRKYETQCAGSMSAHERRIHLEADLSALRAELERKDAALKIYQARSHRSANSTCDGCPFAVAERDVNWADRPEGYYTCGLDNKERWGEDPACPDVLYKEPPCQTA